MVKKYLVQVRYSKLEKPSFFYTDIDNLKIGDFVLVNSDRGEEVGTIVSEPTNIETMAIKGDFANIIARANDTEQHLYNENIKRAKEAIKTAEKEANTLKLEMNFLFAEYILDRSKIIITYTADGRVDFRELLKILANKLHTRIEFKQIGPRDKAKATGGVGPCGRVICCSTFLKNFDGISLNKAKNQQLSLNNAKLSGTCGKLMCCLNYEDETYTQESKAFPQVGTLVKYDKEDYKVLGFNIISRQVKLEGKEGIIFVDLKDLKKR